MRRVFSILDSMRAAAHLRPPIPVGLLLVLLLTFTAADVHSQSAALDPQQTERYRALISELRCLVCQNQSIADSDAPLAADLRAQVQTQLAAGRSDAEIQRYLTDRYGDFVLYRPPFKPSTWLLWAGPFALLLLAIGVAVRFARSRRAVAVPASDPQRVQQLLDDEDQR